MHVFKPVAPTNDVILKDSGNLGRWHLPGGSGRRGLARGNESLGEVLRW